MTPAARTTGKSCATCHAGGKIIKDKAIFVDDILAGNVNAGITMELMGKPLDPGPDDMKSLIIYIKSFDPGPGGRLEMPRREQRLSKSRR